MTARTDASSWALWSQQIQEFLAKHGVLPTPTTGGLSLPHDLLGEAWTAADIYPGQLPDLCRIHGAVGPAAERGAVVLFAWHFAHDEPFLRLPETDEASRHELVEQLLRDAVTAFPVDAINDPWLLRWELLFAAGIKDWERVDELTRRWMAIDSATQHDARAALARIYFLSAHPADKSEWVPDWWVTYEGSEYSFAGEVLSSLYALKLDERSPLTSSEWTLPRTLDLPAVERVRIAASAAAGALEAKPSDPLLKPINAWCSAVLAVRQDSRGLIRDAADRYAEIAGGRNFVGPLLDQPASTVRFPAWSAAMLYRLAGALDEARQITELWTSVDKDAPDAWRFRAEIERLLSISSWPETYMEYVRLAPETETSWEHTELLRLLIESQDQLSADRALRELALSHPDRPAVQSLCSWDWPTYSLLAPATRERWWEGLVFVCDERVQSAFRRQPWRHAAECFGEAVAVELKARVFVQLAQLGVFQGSYPDRERRLAHAVMSARASLGTLIETLALTQDSKSPLGGEIDRFLRKTHGALRAFVVNRKAVSRLREIVDVRNRAAHEDVSANDARTVYQEARVFLDVLVRQDAAPVAPAGL
jgi:hypothetical protein